MCMMCECPDHGFVEAVTTPNGEMECPMCQIILFPSLYETSGLARKSSPGQGGHECNPLGYDSKTHWLDGDSNVWYFRRLEKTEYASRTPLEAIKARAFEVADEVAGRHDIHFQDLKHDVYRELRRRQKEGGRGSPNDYVKLKDYAKIRYASYTNQKLDYRVMKRAAKAGKYIKQPAVEIEIGTLAGRLGIGNSMIRAAMDLASKTKKPSGLGNDLWAAAALSVATGDLETIKERTDFKRNLKRAADLIKDQINTREL